MAQVVVGQQVLPITPNGQHALFVTNLGPNELWYGRDGSVSAASGQPLDPGNAIQDWPVDQPMYVVAPNGNTAVAYESNGSNVAIGAATNVTATLADGSEVGLTPGSVVGLRNGVATLLTTTAGIVAPISRVTAYDSGTTDLSPYSTLKVRAGFGTIGAVDTTRGVRMTINQYTSQFGQLVQSETPEFLNGGYVEYTTEIVAPYIKIDLGGIDTSQTVQGITVMGLTATLPHRYYQYPGNSAQFVNITGTNIEGSALAKGMALQSGNIPAATVGYWFPETIGGPGTFNAFAYASTNGEDYAIIRAVHGQGFLARTVPPTLINAASGTRGSYQPVIWPESPIAILINNRDAAVRQGEVGLTFT